MKEDQVTKLLTGFYYVSVAVMILGAIVLIIDGDFDIYTAWAMVTYLVGAYLIYRK